MKIRRLSRRVLMAGLAVAASGVGLSLNAAPASAVTFTNACVNSAVPTIAAQRDVTLTGTAPASVQPGAPFQLTNINQTLALPGAVFEAGYNLGLLVVGTNTVPGTVKTVIEGTNTVQGTQTTPVTAASVTFTITDPDGSPGTGDETSTDAVVTVNYPDQTWTAGPAGAIEFREDTVTSLSSTVGGIVITATIGGFLTVRFGCDPGTVGPGGGVGDITLIDPAVSFASTVSGTTESTTTSTTSTTTSTTTLPVASKCAGAKLKAAGKKAKCLLGLEAKEAAQGKPKDPDKVEKCKAKFSSAFAKAEQGTDCTTIGDVNDIEDKVDLFVEDVDADLAP